MKQLPAGLQLHLDTATTTLCWCWRLTRLDGVRIGFTDHDRDLSFDGTVFEAASGFSASEIESSVGLSVDNLEASGALQSDKLNEADLAAGLFDDAEIEIFRVNWQDPAQRLLMRAGSVGEITRSEGAFVAEIRGLAHYLQQPFGRIYQYGCDADLGDTRCGVVLHQSAFKATASVVTTESPTALTVSGLETFAAGWFTRGLVTWTSGANAGRKMEVKLHAIAEGTVLLELWQPMAQAVTIGDGFEILAGCDKQFSTCRVKFANSINFRGFPHIPGNDFLVSYPNSDDPANDGSALNK